MEPSAFDANLPQQHQINYAQQQQEHLPLPHMMPFPAETPWNLESMPWTVATKSMEQPGGVMKFSAQCGLLQNTMQKRPQLHHKRKSDIKAPQAPKQFISEEKITAHFNGLHISSDYIQHANADLDSLATGVEGADANEEATTSGKSFTNLTYRDYQVIGKELQDKLKRGLRISICDEIKKLHEEQQNVPFLPHALLNRIEKPCTALVLWQPPPILELLQKTIVKNEGNINHRLDEYGDNVVVDDDDAFYGPNTDIDDFLDNNNTCNLDFNNLKLDGMDTDL